MAICGLCDERYEEGTERAKVHEHPEPQSGPYRRLWLLSHLTYGEWKKTADGQKWERLKESQDRDKPAWAVGGWGDEIKLLCFEGDNSIDLPLNRHNAILLAEQLLLRVRQGMEVK